MLEAATSDQSGTGILGNTWPPMGARLTDDLQWDSITVPSVALDDVLGHPHHLLPPIVINIDAEGAEASVCGGITSILEEFRPVIVCEVHDTGVVRELCAAFGRMLGRALPDYDVTA